MTAPAWPAATAADDEALCVLAESFGASVSRANDPEEFEHLIELTPAQLRALLAGGLS